jgi:regulation of enolase protein 1 (concanavalin A-like superfamily)
MGGAMKFLETYAKLMNAAEQIFESYRGEEYLIQRKWFLAAFKYLFDTADAAGVIVDDDVLTIIKLRKERQQVEIKLRREREQLEIKLREERQQLEHDDKAPSSD